MRILFVTECYHPVRNGIVSVIDILTEQLVRRGNEVMIVAPKHPKAEGDPENVLRIPSLPNPFYPDYPAAIPWAHQISNSIENFKPDIVHTHSFMWLSRFALKHAQRRGIPVITTFHTLVTEYLHYAPVPKFISKPFIAWWVVTFCNSCKVVIIVSPIAEPLLRSFGVKVPIEFIPTGVNSEQFGKGNGFKVRKELKIPTNASILLYVGRIAKEKNIAFLIEALSPVLAERPRTYLLLVGDGPEMDAMKARAKNLPAGERIFFVGSRPRDEIPDFLASADIFVFASITEMQGLAVTEAMMAGLPVVVIGEGGIRHFVKDGEVGFVVPQDKIGFANAVRTLLDKPHLRMAMAERARTYAMQTFSLSACIDRLESLYHRVLSETVERV
ncbi:MAG: glycosyltransferase [Armatimonadetes bacterium]|nr:glycosyltransferase [Armatimonadota bacterium]MDW8026770.1 glycosyltransferase [Armatimonadota bacterium]